MNTACYSKIDWITLNNSFFLSGLISYSELWSLKGWLRGRTSNFPLIPFISRAVFYNLGWYSRRWVQRGTDCLWHTNSLPGTPGCSEHAEATSTAPCCIPGLQIRCTGMAHLRSAGTRAMSRASESHDQEAAVTRSSMWKLPGQTSQLEKEEGLQETRPQGSSD